MTSTSSCDNFELTETPVSPWISNDSSHPNLNRNVTTDVAIIGGGISGIATAYYLLENTSKKVCILEAQSLTSGATGNNAGQAINGFECGYFHIYKTYGQASVIEAFNACETGKYELLRIIRELKLQCDVQECESIVTFNNIEFLIDSIQEQYVVNKILDINLIHVVPISVAGLISEKFKEFVLITSDIEFLQLVKYQYNISENVIGILIYFKSLLLDSKKFSLLLSKYMLSKFNDRVEFFEKSEVKEILIEEQTKLLANNHVVTTHELILCTNAYSLPKSPITMSSINPRREILFGKISEYQIPISIAQYNSEDIYNYLNVRKLSQDKSLFITNNINEFESQFDFVYSSTQAYSDNMLRVVDVDKNFPNIFFNLGCNGIGILLSIYGAKRIIQLMSGKYTKNIFNRN